MELHEARVIVAGASGELGSALARELVARGSDVALAGRDPGRLEALAGELGSPTARFDARDPESCRTAVDSLAAALGGLDALIVCVGAAAFGNAGDVSAGQVREVFEANALGPIVLADTALNHIEPPGALVAVSAVVAEHPFAGMAHYSAAKAALSAYLAAARRERRRSGLAVLDVRPPHLDTGFSRRPLYGTPPDLPDPLPAGQVVAATLEALAEGRREVTWDLMARSLVTA